MTAIARALLEEIVDYAGLFPPAALDMERAVTNYARYLEGDDRWMLGRFVVGVGRLDEFVEHSRSFTREAPWRLSVVVPGEIGPAMEKVEAFNASHNDAVVDMVECKAPEGRELDRVSELIPPGMRAFVEIPTGDDEQLNETTASLAEQRLRAKIRTGGVTADAFPDTGSVSRFIRACYGRSLPFKATAGLHHPMRAEYPLTYESDAPVGVMHGFLNVFLAAAFCFNGIGAYQTPEFLELTDASEIVFSESDVRWKDYVISVTEMEKIRRRLANSFGSCSFEEPTADLRKLNII